MPIAAVDPQWAAIIGAVATLVGALGWGERRRREKARARPFVGTADLDRQAAETILTQWKTVLEAQDARSRWAEQQERLCNERNEALERRMEEVTKKCAAMEWELARRDWQEEQRVKRKRRISAD